MCALTEKQRETKKLAFNRIATKFLSGWSVTLKYRNEAREKENYIFSSLIATTTTMMMTMAMNVSLNMNGHNRIARTEETKSGYAHTSRGAFEDGMSTIFVIRSTMSCHRWNEKSRISIDGLCECVFFLSFFCATLYRTSARQTPYQHK